MELKKSHRANLERRKTINFVVGLLITLSLILIGFEWTTPSNKLADVNRATIIPYVNEMMEITRRDEIKPPPKADLPAIVETIQMVSNDIELEEINFSQEVTKDTWIDFKVYADSDPEVIVDEVEQ